MKPLSNQHLSEQHSLWLYLALALGYFFSGQLLSGMSAQSQVVAIWAPAGFALVGCYLWWWRFFPAVFFASIAFNLQTHDSVQFIDMASDLGLEVSMIAFGATLQAAVGSFLMRNWLGDPLYLRSDQRAIGFIFIVGIIVNLISPNIGVQALSLYNSSYSVENHWNNVLYWWLGDSLGVLITTPLLLSLIDMQYSKERKAHLLVLSAAGLLFTSVTLTTLFFSQNSYHNAQVLAKRELKVVESGLYRQLNTSLNQIQLLSSFVQVNPNVNRRQFGEFVSDLMKDQPNIKAMSWNPQISQAQTKVFEQKLSTIYNKKMRIKGKPLNDSDPIVVVQLISPEQGNEAAIGFNVYSNPKRKSVLSTGHRPHQVMATPIIRLVQSEVAEPGYLLFMPVYGLSTNPKSGDNKPLLGYATGVFLARQMINDALGLSQSDMFLYELYENNESMPFASNTGQAELSLHLDANHLKLNFDLAGQTWHMNLS
ncbi:MAG: CHASE domain-containing protein, partial [Algicola sp.]|nr:CHASE domain-containing protein [Algicola sp.]